MTVCAMVLGIVLGVLFAVMTMSPNPVLRGVARFYIWFFRGTPLLLQLLLWFNLALVFPTHRHSGPVRGAHRRRDDALRRDPARASA